LAGSRTNRVPELLAPAGGPASLRAAVANGADAVYAGLADLNARRGAENFTLETLAEATRHAHLSGVAVYLTANVVVLPEEMAGALDLVASAWEAGVDAVIVQDLGLLTLVRRHLPEVRLHASTQIDAHNASSIAALEKLGVSRVTLARELAIEEIAGLVRTSGVELESFVHGSLCYSHSGQCLFSSMVGGRSANRGLCAQPCRLPYTLIDGSGRAAEPAGPYLLSPKDLAGVSLLPDLVRAGVAALKIEGRMKSPEYVATVVRVYRSALDRAVADPDGYRVTEAEWDLLSEAFSRGFTPAYLSGVRDDSMMSRTRPNNRGVPIGRVVSSSAGRATIALERALESADVLEFWTSAGRFAQTAGPLSVAGSTGAAAPAGRRAEIAVEGPVRSGDRVFRVVNAALTAAARRTYEEADRSEPAVFEVRLRVGLPALVTAEAAGLSATAEGAGVETARTKAVSAEDVAEHVGRLGGSGYVAAGWRIDLDAGVGIAFSTLHHLRREALERLDALRLQPWSGRVVPRVAIEPPAKGARRRVADSPRLVAACSDPAVAVAAGEAGADEVLLAITACDAAPPPASVSLLLPRVAHDVETTALLAHAAGRACCSGNLGLLSALGQAGATVAADWGLNALSAWTSEALGSLGASLVWASPELTGRQLARLVADSPVPVGAVVHGRIELMVAENCVLMSAGECSRSCATCARRRAAWMLEDRKHYRFPVRTDAAGRTHVYNSVPLDLSRALPEIVAAGVAAVRLELHTATPDEARGLVGEYRRLLGAATAGLSPGEHTVESPSTTGHYFRGVR
jgi:putative protease